MSPPSLTQLNLNCDILSSFQMHCEENVDTDRFLQRRRKQAPSHRSAVKTHGREQTAARARRPPAPIRSEDFAPPAPPAHGRPVRQRSCASVTSSRCPPSRVLTKLAPTSFPVPTAEVTPGWSSRHALKTALPRRAYRAVTICISEKTTNGKLGRLWG